jgi:hypothetical protein
MSSDKPVNIVKLGDESFLKTGNALINLSQVKAIEETSNKCIYFYFGMFNNASVCEKDGKEGYNMVKKVLLLESTQVGR